jgi:hypothetical protein
MPPQQPYGLLGGLDKLLDFGAHRLVIFSVRWFGSGL